MCVAVVASANDGRRKLRPYEGGLLTIACGLTKKCHGSPELSQLNCSAMSGRSIQPAGHRADSPVPDRSAVESRDACELTHRAGAKYFIRAVCFCQREIANAVIDALRSGLVSLGTADSIAFTAGTLREPPRA